MNSISRFGARIFSACASLLVVFASAALADPPIAATLGHTTLQFTHVASNNGVTEIGVNDPAFRDLLRREGAVLTWKSGERYILLTTAEPLVVSFAIGDRRYDSGTLSMQAGAAPYVSGDEAYLPFDDVLHALLLAAKRDGGVTVLQPQLAALDIRANSSAVTLVARAGIPLHPRLLTSSADRIVYELDGVGSSLERTRAVNAGGIRSIDVSTSGSARDPHTTVGIALMPGARHTEPSTQGNAMTMAFSASGSAMSTPTTSNVAPIAPAAAQPEATVAPLSPSDVARVTGVSVSPSADGATVTIAVSGNARYEWHRLREPDNRFWIDLENTQLGVPARDESETGPLGAMRVRQNAGDVVRVALNLNGSKNVTVSPGTGGIVIAISNQEAQDVARAGAGTIGSTVSVAEAQPLVTPVPPSAYGQQPSGDDGWKFGPKAYVPTNPRLIVIDPGHGGSDRGAIRNGTSEADLTLDMAKRLQQILIARGWEVRMTRSTDVDVYAPNDSAHEELQARVDVANNAGARLFISIHVNSFINSGPRGTTTYYSKPSDVGLAQSVQRTLAGTLGTKDDGIVKSHLYVTLHSYMPAVLVETAFLSNPDDYARLIDDSWRQRVAQGIADGVGAYTQSNAGSGSGQR